MENHLGFSLTDDSPLQSFVATHRRALSTTAATDSRNSSLNNVWAEDYFCASDTEAGDLSFETDEPITPPPAAALTTRPYPRSIPITEDEASFPARQTRTHQRSLTALLPFRSPKSRGTSKSPERPPNKLHKEKNREEVPFMATLTGDRDGVIKVADKSKGGLAGWFSGTSAPVSLGPFIAEDESSSSSVNSRSASPSRIRKIPQIQPLDSSASTPSKTPATATSMFGFFSPKKVQSPQTIQLPSSIIDNDEFLNLDIQTALFPSGQSDPFSPAAFKNLQLHAEGTILKLQTAYRLRTLSYHELKTETDTQAEELEEAETRAKCLKNQLDDLARRVTEQDQAMEDLVLQLATQKLQRAEEKEAREKSIALVKSSREFVEEDLGITTAGKHWRHSSESDTESATSVFSRSRSPTSTLSSHSDFDGVSSMNESTPEILQASYGRVVSGKEREVAKMVQRPRIQKQRSTFEKMMGGMVDAKPGAVEWEMGGMGLETGCRNCQGKEASVAWDAVGLMRAENRGLKDRVSALESAVEGALDMCAGMIPP